MTRESCPCRDVLPSQVCGGRPRMTGGMDGESRRNRSPKSESTRACSEDTRTGHHYGRGQRVVRQGKGEVNPRPFSGECVRGQQGVRASLRLTWGPWVVGIPEERGRKTQESGGVLGLE